MATLSFFNVGALSQPEASTRLFPLSQTYTELVTGVFLVASVNSARDQCILELLLGTPSTSTTVAAAASNAEAHPVMTAEDEKALTSLRVKFRLARKLHVLEEEGVITAVELVRDYRGTEGGRKRSLESLYVHLFIGTSYGTVFVCNALNGTIMASAQFQCNGRFGDDNFKFADLATASYNCQDNKAVVRFAAHITGPDTRLNANIAQVTSTVPSETLHAVCIVHTGGQVVILGRAALDVFISVAGERRDGKRPYFALEWSPKSTISPYPTAGPAAHFASHVESVFVMTNITHYSSLELQTLHPRSTPAERHICDAAFFLGNKNDTTAVLHNGPEAVESLLLCGNTPALSMYTFENTRAAFSARQTVRAVVSVLSGVARSVWRRSITNTTTSPPPPTDEMAAVGKSNRMKEKLQPTKCAFLEADLMINAVQVDPTSQWAACYSEGAGRIYIYDLRGGVIWRVMKGCRSAEFQWHVATIAGKRMLFLVVHHLLRHAVEMYSLRLDRRVAARYVPKGSILLRPDSTLFALHVLLLNPSGDVIRIQVQLNVCEEETFLLPLYSSSSVGAINTFTTTTNTTDVANGSTLSCTPADEGPPQFLGTRRERRYQMTPRDILSAALHLPLPVPITNDHLFEMYCAQMRELETTVKAQFSPGVSDDRCLSLNPAEVGEGFVPREITAARCLNYIELWLVCVSNYRRALQQRGENAPPYSHARTSSPAMSEGGLFLDGGHPHPLLKQVVGEAVGTLLSECGAEIVALANDVLPSMQRLLSVCGSDNDSDSHLLKDGQDTGEVSPVALDVFLNFFNYGGYKLKFVRGLVLRRELSGGDAADILWAEIGALFFGEGRGLGCLLQQLEVFGALGFQAADVAIVSLCWFCRSFTCSLSPVSLGSLADLILLLKTCSDAAFLTGIEFVACLTRETLTKPKHAEACILLMALCMLIRQHEKPISKVYHNRYVHLLHQLLALRTMFNRCGNLLLRCATFSSRRDFCALRMGDLTPSEGGDALSACFFKLCPHSLAPLLCENIVGIDNLKREMGGVDIILLLKLLFIREGSDDWGSETLWYKDGTWNHSTFLLLVVQPLAAAAAAAVGGGGGGGGGDMSEISCEDPPSCTASPQQLAGLSTLFVVALLLLGKELAPLRGGGLAFLQKSVAPDANLFEGNCNALSGDSAGHPKGSRSTRDYFNSCHEFLTLIGKLGDQLMGQTNAVDSGKVVEAVLHLLSHDDAALFPLIPSMIRAPLNDFIELIRREPTILLRRLKEASSFIDTVMFFAFTEGANMRSLSPSLPVVDIPLSIPWSSMYEQSAVMLQLLPGGDFITPVNGDDALAARMQARSTLLQRFVFMNSMNRCLEDRVEFAKKLAYALGLVEVIPDMPQLILLDASARHLSSSSELNRLLNSVTSRHLAARIAAEDFRIIVACCFKYYIDAKRSVPRENRSELQRIALKLQSMDGTMSEECRLWIRSSDKTKRVSDIAEAMSKTDVDTTEVSLEQQLVAYPGWFLPQDLCVVEHGVRERLQSPRDATRLLDFNALLLVLARVAAEGRSALASTLRSIAAELPSVATRLSNLI